MAFYRFINKHYETSLNKDEIEEWLLENDIYDYNINDDLSVDVDNDVILNDRELEKIPVQFNNVLGCFDVSHNNLLSLKGSPKKVKDFFDASFNYLESLKYFPNFIGENINVEGNNLTVLEYLPKIIRGSLVASANNIIGFLNPPKSIKGWIDLSHNRIHSLRSFPKIEGDIILSNNPLKFTIEELDKLNSKINGFLFLDKNLSILKDFYSETTKDDNVMITISQLRTLLLNEQINKQIPINNKKITRKI